jgi:tetrahydromethanopterin S-methyltransferase subunit F
MSTPAWVEERLAARAFTASAVPSLVLDRSLCIRAVNRAYVQATEQPAESLIGCYMFEAFPDNPATPEAGSVEKLSRSLETVLRRGTRDRMSLQRYDVPSPRRDGTFLFKVWSPTNSPLRGHDGKVDGVLHQVRDVTRVAELVPASQHIDDVDDVDAPIELAEALAHELELNASLVEMNENLTNGLQTSRQIGMAMGILMYSHKITAEAAFELLREVSGRTHRKVRDLAVDIIERGGVDL